jgi:hypothetical protein
MARGRKQQSRRAEPTRDTRDREPQEIERLREENDFANSSRSKRSGLRIWSASSRCASRIRPPRRSPHHPMASPVSNERVVVA